MKQSERVYTDCDGDGVSDVDQIAKGALDVDRNGLPDDGCDGERVIGLPDTIVACTSHDSCSVEWAIDVSDVYGVDTESATLHVYAICRALGPAVMLQSVHGTRAVPGDTLLAKSYDQKDHIARFVMHGLAGRGAISWDVFAGDTLVVRNVTKNIVGPHTGHPVATPKMRKR